MPILNNVQMSYTLTYIELDIVAMNANVKLTQRLNGIEFGAYEFQIQGVELGAILQEVPTSTSNLANHVADSVYAYAISKGYIQGTIA